MMRRVAVLASVLAFTVAGCGDPPSASPEEAAFSGELVFTTSSRHNGKFPGRDAGDGICQSRATDAGYGGRFVAWLSDNFVNASDRITSDGPWFLVDQQTLVFENKDALSGPALAPIHLDETGTDVGIDLVWTGTLADGGGVGYDTCEAWTDDTTDPTGAQLHPVSGVAGSTDGLETWSELNVVSCVNELRLLCFEL